MFSKIVCINFYGKFKIEFVRKNIYNDCVYLNIY